MSKRRPPAEQKTVRGFQLGKPVRVLLLGQHALVRSGIHALLERIQAIKIVESAGNQEIPASIEVFKPDVVLLDVVTPGKNGLQLLKQLAQKFSTHRLIAIIPPEDEGQLAQALALGLAGLISKNAGGAELEMAIKAVARGERYVSEIFRQDVIKSSESPPGFRVELTPRQFEVLKMIVTGHSTKEIARHLDIGVKTVETHRARMMERLDIHDIASLVRYALRVGIIKRYE